MLNCGAEPIATYPTQPINPAADELLYWVTCVNRPQQKCLTVDPFNIIWHLLCIDCRNYYSKYPHHHNFWVIETIYHVFIFSSYSFPLYGKRRTLFCRFGQRKFELAISRSTYYWLHFFPRPSG